jgi:gliding motility-associated-like protein
MICVHPVPLADFSYGPQQVFSDGPEVSFTNTSVDHDFSAWDFGDGSTSGAESPEHVFPIGEIGNYEVELIVTTSFGCSDTTSQIIVVKDQLLYYVPNTFTPDADQFNPVFLPVMTAGMDENDYHLEIYNRWGEIVFQTDDIHEGWDGSFGGRSANEGTYTWKLRFGMMDDDSAVVATGHVNLVR